MSHADREPRISLQEQIAAVTCAVPWIAQHRQALDAAARTLRELQASQMGFTNIEVKTLGAGTYRLYSDGRFEKID